MRAPASSKCPSCGPQDKATANDQAPAARTNTTLQDDDDSASDYEYPELSGDSSLSEQEEEEQAAPKKGQKKKKKKKSDKARSRYQMTKAISRSKAKGGSETYPVGTSH